MEFMEIMFPEEQSADILINNSLSIDKYFTVVLPYLPNISILNLLCHHEILITKDSEIENILLLKLFSMYGDIVDIVNISILQCVIIFAY